MRHEASARQFAMLAVALAALGCGPSPTPAPSEESVTRPSIEQVQELHQEEWMTLPGVVGTGIGLCNGEPCIRIFLSAASPEASDSIPDRVEGYRVDLEVTGSFEPQ